MTVRLGDVISFLDATLAAPAGGDDDDDVDGLQVEGSQEVDTIVTATSASLELFARAAEMGADLIVVHHGLLSRSAPVRIVGHTARRLAFLLDAGISLAAYRLPLIQHPRLGNNIGLCDALALGAEKQAFGGGPGEASGLAASWPAPLSREEAIGRVAAGLLEGRSPRDVLPFGPEVVRKVGVSSGSGCHLLEAAAAAGCDLFVTGELAERSAALARELQITLVGAGHHVTEVFGPQRLIDELRHRFNTLDVRFVDIPSPL